MAEDKNKHSDKDTGPERGAMDDWESIKLVLDELPSLKQRVLHHIRATRSGENDTAVSRKQRNADRLRAKRK